MWEATLWGLQVLMVLTKSKHLSILQEKKSIRSGKQDDSKLIVQTDVQMLLFWKGMQGNITLRKTFCAPRHMFYHNFQMRKLLIRWHHRESGAKNSQLRRLFDRTAQNGQVGKWTPETYVRLKRKQGDWIHQFLKYISKIILLRKTQLARILRFWEVEMDKFQSFW